MQQEKSAAKQQFELPDSNTEKDIPPVAEECKYVLPTPEAVRSFFKVPDGNKKVKFIIDIERKIRIHNLFILENNLKNLTTI